MSRPGVCKNIKKEKCAPLTKIEKNNKNNLRNDLDSTYTSVRLWPTRPECSLLIAFFLSELNNRPYQPSLVASKLTLVICTICIIRFGQLY